MRKRVYSDNLTGELLLERFLEEVIKKARTTHRTKKIDTKKLSLEFWRYFAQTAIEQEGISVRGLFDILPKIENRKVFIPKTTDRVKVAGQTLRAKLKKTFLKKAKKVYGMKTEKI